MSTLTKGLSLWWDTLEELPARRRSLEGNLDVDVAIVGGGFTGLWTARSLLMDDPSLRVCIIEAEVCGFGASGRNGGWASALFSASDAKLTREHGASQATAMRQAMINAIGEIERSALADEIDCDFQRGGTLVAARTEAQRLRCMEDIEEARIHGNTEDDLRWLEADEARGLIGATDVLGATFTPHCAAIHPAKLAAGLAKRVEKLGGTIVEGTRVNRIRPGGQGQRPRAETDHGIVTADVIVRATEGWSSQLPDSARSVIPVYSLMIATEPLDPHVLEQIGLRNRETFSDHRHMIIYGQRTADGRIAFGGRGAPYHYGSAIKPAFDRDAAVFAQLRQTLIELFPVLSDSVVTHTWGGPLGIPRDWHSSVGLDWGTGVAWAGGYVGDGVTTTNLAGRTLADLIQRRDTDLTRLAWVGHRSPDWEPEPLRWLGVNAGLSATVLSDRIEDRTGRPSKLADLIAGSIGH